MNRSSSLLEGPAGSTRLATPGAFLALGLTCVLAIMLIGATGCSDGRPERVPVSGRVLIDGQPVTHGIVTFVPAGARPSMGMLDGEGRFVLGCFDEDDGAVPGDHAVAVMAREMLGDMEARWHAPKRYSDHRTSGLRQTIDAATDSITIELSWDGESGPFVEKFD